MYFINNDLQALVDVLKALLDLDLVRLEIDELNEVIKSSAIFKNENGVLSAKRGEKSWSRVS